MSELTPEQILAALDTKTSSNADRALDPVERKRRALAQQRAQQDARNALARLHPDEYKALYAAAVERRLETTTEEDARKRLQS